MVLFLFLCLQINVLLWGGVGPSWLHGCSLFFWASRGADVLFFFFVNTLWRNVFSIRLGTIGFAECQSPCPYSSTLETCGGESKTICAVSTTSTCVCILEQILGTVTAVAKSHTFMLCLTTCKNRKNKKKPHQFSVSFVLSHQLFVVWVHLAGLFHFLYLILAQTCMGGFKLLRWFSGNVENVVLISRKWVWRETGVVHLLCQLASQQAFDRLFLSSGRASPGDTRSLSFWNNYSLLGSAHPLLHTPE